MKKIHKMALGWFLGIVLAATHVNCSTVKTDEIGKNQPSAFTFNVSSHMCGFTIERSQGRFWQSVYKNGKIKRRQLKAPSSGKWSEFFAAIKSLRVREWLKEYKNPDQFVVNDGERWDFTITTNDLSLTVAGDNCYPSDGNPRIRSTAGGRTGYYRGFEAAVSNLFELKELYSNN